MSDALFDSPGRFSFSTVSQNRHDHHGARKLLPPRKNASAP